MDSFEFNKVAGAVLGTCLVLLVVNITAGSLFSPHQPATQGYNIAVAEEAPAAAAAAPAPSEPIAVLLAKASTEKGEASAKKCAACHTFTKDGPNRVGPNLYGVVGRALASHAGFNYSAAMKAKGGEWTFDNLNHFLASPKGFIPGTAMGFAGLPRDSERADVIDYLRTLADTPTPLPAP